MPRVMLQENSFQFNGKDFLQAHGTAMGTNTAVSFANIFLAKIETAIIDQQNTKPLVLAISELRRELGRVSN